mmetsp:Transcript_23398/g.47354  ORF Transcript_23398/g.47354 Transcript_23398/m.47354 type:complete len:820 (-) Transcript_23398:48-2507(-)
MNDYPLNCIDNLSDGFSGWFAISNPRKCNDFCYWHHEPIKADSGNDDENNAVTDDDENNNDEDGSSGQYTAWNTANPHKTTMIKKSEKSRQSAYWVCVYDAVDDSILASHAEGKSWVDTWQKFIPMDDTLIGDDGVPFPFLRCQKGAGERLKTTAGELAKSAPFWESWIVLATLFYLGEFCAIILYCKLKRGKAKYERVGGASTDIDCGDDAERDVRNDSTFDSGGYWKDSQPPTFREVIDRSLSDGDEGLDNTNRIDGDTTVNVATPQLSYTTPRCKFCAPHAFKGCKKSGSARWWLVLVLKTIIFIALNAVLAFTISFSAISLMEINSNPSFKESMENLTPQCLNPDHVCPVGNNNVEKESIPWKSNQEAMQPFSYIVASDSQLYWFNGEFAEMGVQNIPSSCSPHDSCGTCTGKFGRDVNMRLKKAWESLMNGVGSNTTRKYDENNFGEKENNKDSDSPVPNTLVMNGDLTAYFHPYEKRAYESIYDDIIGLKSYFPSLGNHDIEHMSGAMFGGDQWAGPPNCNIEHAIGYFKGGFCGKIPNFNPNRIIRYDASSLAYSWEEGRFHFVHTHYYPAYEMASMKYRSSLEWLENDLKLASEAGLKTILFVHAVQYLNPAMERIILGKDVIAIFAGHTHRCLHRKCEGIYPLHQNQVDSLDSSEFQAEKCIPAAYDICSVLNGENLIYTKDVNDNVTLPKKKLENTARTDKPLCPKPTPYFINETDNSLLCRRVLYSEPNFPFDSGNDSAEVIPIFWSGSSSFETFLQVNFFSDHVVINAMTTASKEGVVARYIDLHPVPNARYPFHESSDLQEVVISF